MSVITVTVGQELDETGEPEEFTWDIWPLVPADLTTHLDRWGLPKPGTRIVPGMIIVGKLRKTKHYDPGRCPTPLEVHGWPHNKLEAKYGNMWKDGSIYASAETAGIVLRSTLERHQGGLRAIVEIERGSTE
jgi:DNA-directed RNA polymerase beta subunit